jgi:hypothetical protein
VEASKHDVPHKPMSLLSVVSLYCTCNVLHTFDQMMVHSMGHRPVNVPGDFSLVHLDHKDQIHACSQVFDKFPEMCLCLH